VYQQTVIATRATLSAVASLEAVPVQGKVYPYSLPSVGPGADFFVQAVSPQVTFQVAVLSKLGPSKPGPSKSDRAVKI